MKKYKSSDLTNKRAEVLKEAKENGVIIQECNTNGDVRQEYVLLPYDKSNASKVVFMCEPLLNGEYEDIRLECKGDL